MIEQIDKTIFQELMPSGDKVEIGDLDSKDFKPHLKLNRWDGECFIKVGLPVTEKSLPIIDGDKITWEGRNRHILMYPFASKQFELGAYEYEVVLEKKPKSNKIVIALQTQGLRFCYQPALTRQEIEDGDIRPDNIVGSYAVYHTTKQDHILGQTNYGCGKAFHIPRPKIFDSRGDWVWGELHYDGLHLITTIPQEFLETAYYPIRHAAGDTFGYTTKGATSSSFEGTVCGAKFTMGGTGGTAQKMTAWLFDVDKLDFAGARKCAIYLASDLSAPIANGQTEERTDILPDGPVANATEFDFDFGTDPTVVASTDYCLYIWGAVDATGRGDIARDTDAGVDRWFEASAYNGWPALSASDRTGKFSIYCTYTEGAPPAGWAGGDVNGVALASIGKISGIAIADIGKVSGI